MPPPNPLAELLSLPQAALVERLCTLTAPEREILHQPARRARAANEARMYGDTPGRYSPSDATKLGLILLATEPAAEQRWPQPEGNSTFDAEWRIVVSRGQRFLDALARAHLRWMAETMAGVPEFPLIRDHQRSGTITVSFDDTYVLAMISGLTGRFQGDRSKADLLRADPELLDQAFWRIFEVEGNREVSLANIDRFQGPETQSWQEAVLELAADGTIDRQRVLDRTLAALAAGFPQYRAGWFSRLHDALLPTMDEIATRQAAYAGLLRSPLGPTVTLALGALTALDNAARLDDALTNAGLAAAVHVPARTTANKAVRLAGRIMRRNTAAGLSTLAAALRHPHADVQSAALTELRRHGDPSARAEVERQLDQLAPSTAATARQWLRLTDPPTPGSATAVPDRPHPVPTAAVPAPVIPITEPAELAEALAVLLAHPDDAELGERCLGAAARLGADPTLYAPLSRRAHRLHQEAPHDWSYVGVSALVLACAGEHPADHWRPGHHGSIIAGRFREVTRLLRAGERRQLAAEPTHQGGWVEPRVLVDRLSTTPDDALPLDTVAALLRLGPPTADRTGPLARITAGATALPQRLHRPLTYALGGPPPAGPVTGEHPLWIAAARARAPYDDDTWLGGLPTGTGEPALDVGGAGRTPRWTLEVTRPRYGGQLSRFWALEVKPVPDAPAPIHAADPSRPTVSLAQLHVRPWTYEGDPAGPRPRWSWASLVWPGNVDPVLALGLDSMWSTVHGVAEPDATAALDLLASSPAAPGTLGRHLLATGFASASVAERTAAVDAATVLLPHRLGVANLAAAMLQVAPAVPVSRWTAALTELSTAGRGDQVLALLTALLPGLDRSTRGLHGLVELLRDEHLRANTPVTDPPLRAWLTAIARGNSKTARAATTLTAL